VAGTPATNGNGTIFVLSISEYTEYSSEIAAPSVNWWLRSTGLSLKYSTSVVNGKGSVNYVTAVGTTMGYCPAMWVKS
jgi:hypothetical protein